MVDNKGAQQMKVQVRGCNYTGHHFRQLSSPYDGRTVDITLIGSEQQIVKFVLDNFDWGGSAARFPTVSDLCSALSNDDALNADGYDPTEHENDEDEDDEDELDDDGNPTHLQLGQFDGAGGVVWIKDENGEELFEVSDLEYFADNKVFDLGEFDLDKVDKFRAKNGLDSYDSFVNHMVKEMVDADAAKE
jgi:hypothetical protein